MNKSLLLAASLTALSASPAFAGASQHSFAWTHQPGAVSSLFVNGSTLLTATARGWVDQDGLNNLGGANANYIAGICGSSDACSGSDKDAHNYFVFDLAGIGSITSAELRLTQPGTPAFSNDGFLSTNPTELYTLWDASVSAADRASLTFADLASGISFGSVLVGPSSNGTTVSVLFNASGLSALNAFSSAGQSAIFGGALSTGTTAVPEPATWAMMITGFGLVGASARRRRTRVTFMAKGQAA